MGEMIDARGLSCPQPVIMTTGVMRKVQKGQLVILVDTETSKENVIRATAGEGWELKDVTEEGGAYRITVVKE
jgi:tRNA 2-thiouridine synthesizing protein A